MEQTKVEHAGVGASKGRSRGPVTDSPWFWVASFAVSGIIFLVCFSPRLEFRRSQLAGRFYARQLGGQAVPGVDVRAGRELELTGQGGVRKLILPMYAILTSLVVVSVWKLRTPRS